MNFCLGNAVKYIWRADLKGDAIEDLEKAAWYIKREIQKRKTATFRRINEDRVQQPFNRLERRNED